MKASIATDKAPAAIGPYSQAIRSGGFVFLSGQIPLDPATGELVQGTIADETHRVMKNLGAVLAAAKLGFEHVVRATIYVVDLGHFAEINAVYATYFQEKFPARATVQVAALPRGARVEIDAIACES